MSFFAAMGFPISIFGTFAGRGRADGTGTADGGRNSRIDFMIDNDGPFSRVPDEITMAEREARSKRSRARRSFSVTEKTRLGGSGLYHGDDEEK
jgi:hypothetical protein